MMTGYESHREDGDGVRGEGAESEGGDAAVVVVECEGAWENEDGSGAEKTAESLCQSSQGA